MSLANHIPPIYPNKDVDANPDNWSKVSSYIKRDDFRLVNATAAQSGAISFIIDHAIKHTADAIRRGEFVPVVDTQRFFDWLRQRTFTEPPRTTQVAAGNVPGRASSARQPVSHAAHVVAGVGTDVETGKGGGRRKASAKST